MAGRYSDGTFFTPKQVRLIESVIKYDNLKTAAKSIGVSYPAAKQIFYRLRKKYRQAVVFEREVSPKIKKVLAITPACWNCEHLISHVYKDGKDFVTCTEAGSFVEDKTIPRCSLFEWKGRKRA